MVTHACPQVLGKGKCVFMNFLRGVSVDRLKMDFLTQYQGFLSLQEQLVHSPGCLLHKGPQRQYVYWQFYLNGRQVQKRVLNVEQTKQEIEQQGQYPSQFQQKALILSMLPRY